MAWTRKRCVAHTSNSLQTKGVGKGTGLGLSTVQGIANQSSGCLVLNSRMSEGTTAEIWLPLGEEIIELATLGNPLHAITLGVGRRR